MLAVSIHIASRSYPGSEVGTFNPPASLLPNLLNSWKTPGLHLAAGEIPLR